MSGSNKGLWLVLGGGAVAGVAVAVLYTTVLAPDGDAEKMHAHIQSWGDKWATARTCLVGDAPASADGGDAMTIRQTLLTGLETDLKGCEPVLEALIFQRVEESTGNMSVEALWDDLDKAVYPLRLAVNRFVNGEARSSSELPNAIDRVDNIYAKLRAAAGMKEQVWTGAPPLAQPPAGAVVVGADGTPVFPTDVRTYGSVLEVKGGSTVVRLPNLTSASVRTESYDVTTAADTEPWGAWPDHEETDDGEVTAFRVVAGAVDANGHRTDAAVVVATASPKKATGMGPMFAAGSGDARAVVYQLIDDTDTEAGKTEEIAVAQSADRGATWKQSARTPRAELSRVFVTSGRDRIDIANVTDAGALLWTGLSAANVAAPIAPVTLVATGATPPTAFCADDTRSWWEVNDSLYTATASAPGTAVGNYVVSGALLCDGDRLLAISEGMGVLTVTQCTPAGCDEGRELSVPAGGWRAAIGDAHQAIVLFATEGMLFAWDATADQTRAVYKLADLSLAAAIEWDGTIYAALRADDQLRLVPIPLGQTRQR